MTDTRRYALVWLAAAFLGLNVGAGALLAAFAAADSWLHLHGWQRQAAVYAPSVIALVATTLAIGRAFVRLVTKQLN